MSDFEKAKERAHSRANTLQNLQNSYKKKELAIEKQKEAPLSQSASTSNAVDIVLSATGDRTKKTRVFVSDAINGKQIILDNAISQADMIKNAIKTKIQNKRRTVISNKKLKKLGLCDPLTRPCNNDVQVLHDLWWGYIKEVIKSCTSEAQLQARLLASDVVGARAYVIDSTSSSQLGTRGIITAVSKNCYYLLVDVIQRQKVVYVDEDGHPSQREGDDQPVSKRRQKKLDRKQFLLDRQQQSATSTGGKVSVVSPPTTFITSVNSKHKHSKPILGHILRLVKDQCNLALVLPSLSSQRSSVGLFTEPDLDALSTKTPVKRSSSSGEDRGMKMMGGKRPRGDNDDDDNEEEEEQGSGDESDDNSNDSDGDGDGSSDDVSHSSSDGEGLTRYVKKKGSSEVLSVVDNTRLTGQQLNSEIRVDGDGVGVGKVVVQPFVVFDGNEKSNGGRLCILYGKHFMPYCKYDEK